jgi:prepilin-type processing-associated H-X9-DG protein
MDENLVGYLLNSLDAPTHARVELYLRTHPEARARLEILRHALQPLAEEEVEPPPGLWLRTLDYIAQNKPARAPRLPVAPRPSSALAPAVPAWRRMDVLVAACLLLLVGSLGVTWLAGAAHNQAVVACQDNLRQFYGCLWNYSEHHNRSFPRVDRDPPCNVAGVFVPMLNDSGCLAANVNLSCPASGTLPPPPPSLEQLRQAQNSPPGGFQAFISSLGNGYAYSLGYTDQGGLFGLRSDEGERLPIMADCPQYGPGSVVLGNSPNHGGKGQNVLYIDGHVQFCTQRTVGVGRDDIYVNSRGEVAAGSGRFDTVLGASWACPYPHQE